MPLSYCIIGTGLGSAFCALLGPAVLNLIYFFQTVMELEADATVHESIFVVEAGFHLTKTRRRGRYIIGYRATFSVPGQCVDSRTLYAAISQNYFFHHHATLGP